MGNFKRKLPRKKTPSDTVEKFNTESVAGKQLLFYAGASLTRCLFSCPFITYPKGKAR